MKIKISFLLIILHFLLFTSFLKDGAYAACNVSATGISFGSYDVFSNIPVVSTGSITITCDPGQPPDVVVSIGPSPNSGGFSPRKIRHSSLQEYLSYNLFTDPSMTVVWGNGTAGTSTVTLPKVTPNKPRTVTFYGKLPAGQDVYSGAYSDTLTVTIMW